jgi:pyridoxamine 5'-phosphate oxidase
LFHWKSLQRQVRIRGDITLVSAAEADAYYDSRARGSRIGAWASDQSKPLESRATLEQSVAALETTFGTAPIPRPPQWTGFRVTPREIELWHDRPFRLHDRVVFRRSDEAQEWTATRLYP